MSKGLPKSLSRGDALLQEVYKYNLLINNLAISIADGVPGFGTVVIAGLPQGNLLFLGAVSYIQITSTDADITATFDGDFSIGTAPTADGVLSGSEIDIVASTALGAATAGVSPLVRGPSTATEHGVIFDNTAGTLELNLNVLIDDAAISGAVDATVDGTFHGAFIVLGDD